MSRRGFTLVELLIGMLLLGLVTALTFQLLLLQHWAGESQVERAALQSSLRSASVYLVSELRELGGTIGDPDLLVFSPESLTYRAMRGTGTACLLDPATITLTGAGLAGYRSPQVGRDSLLVLWSGRGDEGDDRWIHLPLQSIGSGSCAGAPALVLGTTIDTLQYSLTGFPTFPPVRTFEIMQVRLYQSGGDYWLGSRSVSAGEIIQPVAGPFPAHGITFGGLDSADVPTSAPDLVRAIRLRLLGLTGGPVRNTAGIGTRQRLLDSVASLVLLRNW